MNQINIAVLVHIVLTFLVILRIMLRPHREPASRIAWIVVVASAPGFGMLMYLLLGETNIGFRRVERMQKALDELPKDGLPDDDRASVPHESRHLFDVAKSISGFSAAGGNSAQLMADSNATIDSMVADIDAAQQHVHLVFYIWLSDNNGCKMMEALKRAAARGVKCRAMADSLGSRALIKSPHWKAMRDAGVHVAEALPIPSLLLSVFARVDLRNHRKILVIDGRITYCGSQNCADPEFRVKPKYAPWVDAVMRWEGPIARQNQFLFASDWMANVDENIDDVLREPLPSPTGKVTASVVASGPTVRFSAMPEMFESLIDAARQELIISTPYYVPNESLQGSLCAAAYRGVETTIIFPARNDSWIVGAASHSYYADLLAAGVKIHEYAGGLLHTKSLTIDGQVALIGSANMDRRSFDLNYENNILVANTEVTNQLRTRQQQYLASSKPVTESEVAAWSIRRRLFNNTIATLGPVL
ncbi:MAG: cardiolipin synthase [Rubripirellula sp.]|nr:cardiolipin synthase [Rubripirellula sp.]